MICELVFHNNLCELKRISNLLLYVKPRNAKITLTIMCLETIWSKLICNRIDNVYSYLLSVSIHYKLLLLSCMPIIISAFLVRFLFSHIFYCSPDPMEQNLSPFRLPSATCNLYSVRTFLVVTYGLYTCGIQIQYTVTFIHLLFRFNVRCV